MPFSDGAFSKLAFSSDPVNAAPPSGNTSISGVSASFGIGNIGFGPTPRAVVGQQAGFGVPLSLLVIVTPNQTPISVGNVETKFHIGRPNVAIGATLIGTQATFGINAPNVLIYHDGFSMDFLNCTTLKQPPTDTDISLRWSDTAGASWSNTILQTLGAEGQYLTNIQFLRLGMARNRIFEVRWTGPIRTALTGVFIDFDILGT